MMSLTNAIQLAGDARLQSSIGTFALEVASEQVWMDIPDCRGDVTMFSFTFTDWARICDLMKATATEVLQ